MYEHWQGEEKRFGRPPALDCDRTSLPEIHAHSLHSSTYRVGVPLQRSSVYNGYSLTDRFVLMAPQKFRQKKERKLLRSMTYYELEKRSN